MKQQQNCFTGQAGQAGQADFTDYTDVFVWKKAARSKVEGQRWKVKGER